MCNICLVLGTAVGLEEIFDESYHLRRLLKPDAAAAAAAALTSSPASFINNKIRMESLHLDVQPVTLCSPTVSFGKGVN